MSDQDEALARRWMASKHWGGWRAGMVSNQSDVCCTSQIGVGTSEPVVWADTADLSWVYAPPNTGELPDLDHPGTRAFLLEDVRHAWGENCSVTLYGDDSVSVDVPGTPSGTEAIGFDSLVAALEAAPE